MRLLFKTAAALLACVEFRLAIAEWGRTSRITNMATERLLAMIKHAAPGHAPSIERMCSTGFLTQLIASHKKLGRSDPRYHFTKDAVRKGAPLNLSLKRPHSSRTAFSLHRHTRR